MVGNESVVVGVEHVARVLVAKGATREAMAMLRGAVARSRANEQCAQLLEFFTAGETDIEPPPSIELELALVDLWIRRGMLVEALALLGGTPMGTAETGREWANLLGELLAPVPVDAEETLKEMHRQLVSGGASVALMLLTERARREPRLPAWAVRRLELLRWMLLDNARAAEARPDHEGEIPTALAGAIRPFIRRRNLPGALAAVEEFARDQPSERDAQRTVAALRAIVEELGRYADDQALHGRTIPVVGHSAAAMQLRMGNLKQARAIYQKTFKKNPSDEKACSMVLEVGALMRALVGEPVAEQEMDVPTTEITRVDVPPEYDELSPQARGAEPRDITFLDDLQDTQETPSAEAAAMQLVEEGRLADAEKILRGLASLHPKDNAKWLRRAEELRAKRLWDDGPVLVHSIKPVK